MISYDVQNALNQKADKFEVQNLSREIQSLHREIKDVSEKNARLYNDNGNLRDIVGRLIDLLSEEKDDDMFNRLQHLKNSL